LVEVPFGIDQPYWIEDPDFDLDFHVRHVGLPHPGTDEQLAELVERIMARPLDRNRPLWELYLIEGLESGHIANLTKMHHSAVDGVSGAEVLTTLLDLDPVPRKVDPPETPWKSEAEPSEIEMLGRGLVSVATRPVMAMRLLRDLASNLPAVARTLEPFLPGPAKAIVGRGDRYLSEAPTTPPRTSFNHELGPHRKYAFTSVPLADFKTIKNSFGVTLNDVVMAVCASALRSYLDARDELPDDALIAMVPVSIRTEEESGELGNRVATMTASLHTEVADPVERMRLIHESMMIAKETHNALPASIMQDFFEFSPPAVAARAARATTRLAARGRVDLPYNIVISNVPGPQIPIYGNGALMVGNYPVSTVTDGSGLNITVQSYNGSVDFGVIGDRDQVPDAWDIIRRLQDATDELVTRSSAPESASEKAGKKKAGKKKSGKKKSGKKKATAK
jgi:WS/DGAT/MGAT family acyltransferase